MSNHYLEFAIRCDDREARCNKRKDAYQIFDQWVRDADRTEVILVRIDTAEEVLDSNEWAK